MRTKYMEERFQKMLGNTKKPEAVKKEQKLTLSAWYDTQASQAPEKCENCKGSLTATITFHSRAHICHIVPKTKEGGCPSVATHPLNRWFGCSVCHTNYDTWTAKKEYDKIQEMKVLPVIQARAAQFFELIAESERRRVPAFLIP